MAYNLKLPGTAYMYAFSMALFGQTTEGIRIGLLFVNLGSIVFLFLIGRRIFSSFTALVAVSVYAALSVNYSFLAQAAHATHYVTFFMLGGVYLLIKAIDNEKWYWYLLSGLFMGLAFLMKQAGFFFAIFGALIIILHYFFVRRKQFLRNFAFIMIYSAGVAVPVAVVFMVMAKAGVFDRFWFWTFVYPGVYGSKIPVSRAFEMLRLTMPPILQSFSAFWIMAGLAIPALFIFRGNKTGRIFLALFAFFSLLPAVPGFYFRQHYFIPFIPALGLLGGFFLDTLNQKAGTKFKYINWLTGSVFAILLISGLVRDKNFYFNYDPKELGRTIYGGNPFTEMLPVANYIKSHTAPDDRILVMGSEPEIYFYADRKSATGYIYMYDLSFEHPYVKQMQKEMQEEVEKNNPKMIVYLSCPYSWLASKPVVDSLFAWFNSYLQKNQFRPTGVVDYLFPEPSVYAWDAEMASYQKKSDSYIMVFTRDEKANQSP
jgi:hypothetical protein